MEIKKDMNNIHDKSYKDLLSNKEVFINMIDSFIDTEWSKIINKDDLLLINKSYILSDYEELESDIVYKAKIGDEEVFFYILLEFQSSVDYSMPIRLFLYMAEIWREQLKNFDKNTIKRKNFRLPAIVPIVLYNGEENWTVAREFKDIINRSEVFGNNIINFKYELLDINRYEKDELMDLGNIISAIFMLDQKVDFVEFINRLKDIALTFHGLGEKEKMVLRHWLRNVMSDDIKDELKNDIENILIMNKQEVERMTSNISKTITEIKDEGREEGINLTKKVFKLANKGKSITDIAKMCKISEEEVKDILE